jgi:phosphoserine phosphatase
MTDYLFVTDFDKTLSVDDAGLLLSLRLGLTKEEFDEKIKRLKEKSLTKFGAEVPYLILHDPDFRGKVNREVLMEVGREIRLKRHLKELVKILNEGIAGNRFSTHVISAAPQEVLERALQGILPPENVHGTLFEYDERGFVSDVKKAVAGAAKVEVLDNIRRKEKIPIDRTIYVGDGFSDMYIIMYVRAYHGYTIAVTPTSFLGHICKKTIISNDALSLLAPILEDILGFSHEEVQAFYEKIGHPLQTWEKAKVEWFDFGTEKPSGEPRYSE